MAHAVPCEKTTKRSPVTSEKNVWKPAEWYWLYEAFYFFLSFPHLFPLITCLCYHVLSQPEANALQSSSPVTRLFSPCGRSCWAVIWLSVRSTVTQRTWIRKRSAVVCVWPLSSAAGELIVQMLRARPGCAINQKDDSLPPYSRDL